MPPWGPRDVLRGLGLALLALAILGGGALGALAGLGLARGGESRGIALLAASLGFEAALLGVALALTLGRYRCRWSHLGFRPPAGRQWWLPMATLGAAFAILLVYTAIVRLLGLGGAQPRPTLDLELFRWPSTVALAGVLALLVAPVAEETFFRGFIFAGLRRRWGFWRAATLSGLLFALPHGDPGSLIPFTGVGIVLAGAYAYSGSLWTVIVAHALFNLTSFVAVTTAALGGGP